MSTRHVATLVPADPNINPERYSAWWFRFFEVFPGATAWIAIIAPFILSFYVPLSVTIFILLFDIYWLIRALNYGVMLVDGRRKMQRNLKTDWKGELAKIDAAGEDERERLGVLDWNKIYHAIIIPEYKEAQAILEASIDSIVHCDFPKDRIIIVLATEGRDAENARPLAAALSKKYEGKFLKFLVTEHPDGIVGEIKAKAANATWAARKLTETVNEMGIPLENVVVSTADADTRFPKNFFSCLAYNYAVTPDRRNAGYQPIATFFNNIWDAPLLSRIMAFNTTFWQLIESIRSYRLLTFSTHSMSLATLVDIDYWCTSIVNEDSRQYFRAYFHYKGQFRVIPLFMPIYMDAVYTDTAWGTLKNLYYQQQRWAYGVEHFPYIVLESIKQKKISLSARLSLIFRAYEGGFSWATSSFFITVVGWLPITLNSSFKDHIVASNFPLVTKVILSLTWIGTLVTAWTTIALLPSRPQDKGLRHSLVMVLQWLLVPICAIFFGAIPGIDAQTRLMLGKYLGFRVTEKRVSRDLEPKTA
jgi:hypothetical protein